MPHSLRFLRIAQDLEKLPCELHDAVLKDLEFEQLLRLSESAGPRLSWSLENSLSPWGLYFRDGNVQRLRSLLAITDSVRKYCFKPLKKKTTLLCLERQLPPEQLRFLFYRGSDWSQADGLENYSSHLYQRHTSMTKASLADATSLSNHWLASLNVIVINTTWQAFHADYHRLIEPWVTRVAGAAVLFPKIPLVGEATRGQSSIHLKAKQSALSLEELQNFVTLYQQLRQVRAETLATELCRLADIYQKHPTRLKQPFAPQTRRLNEKHIATDMRKEARKMTKRVVNTWWRGTEMYKHRFAFPFPGLVPYDWTLRFFVRVLQKHIVPELAYHKEIIEKARIVQNGLPEWALSALSFKVLTEQIDRWAPKNKQPLDTSLTMWHHADRTHAEEYLVWLQKFGEVVAWMEVVFPQELEEVRGPGWITGTL